MAEARWPQQAKKDPDSVPVGDEAGQTLPAGELNRD